MPEESWPILIGLLLPVAARRMRAAVLIPIAAALGILVSFLTGELSADAGTAITAILVDAGMAAAACAVAIWIRAYVTAARRSA